MIGQADCDVVHFRFGALCEMIEEYLQLFEMCLRNYSDRNETFSSLSRIINVQKLDKELTQ